MTRTFSISSKPHGSQLNSKDSPIKAAFLADAKTQSAVLHQLLILGEAVKPLSPEFRTARPELPWKAIAGTRDQLIHFYGGVDLDEVWNMVASDLPELIHVVELLAPTNPPSGANPEN